MDPRYVAARMLSSLSERAWGRAVRLFSTVSPGACPRQVEAQLRQALQGHHRIPSLSELHCEWDLLHEQGGGVCFLLDDQYPSPFLKLTRPPLFLTYRGTWKNHPQSFACVGSREVLRDTEEWMQANLRPIVKTGYTLVSGGARGVDQVGHWLCWALGRPTIVFLPSGLLSPYPSTWKELGAEVQSTGSLLVSDRGPFEEMRPHYFAFRNRLIAAFSTSLLVVQAARASGSTMTARYARELDRELGVVPGFPGSRQWLGSCDLLAQGAHPVRDSEDLQTLLERASSKIF